jgi:hypothetical protein
MSAILQTLIGAAAAIVGGFVGAWWQTRRADDIARRIRQEERQEKALLDFIAKATEAHSRIDAIYHAAKTVPLTNQYEAARQAVEELRQLWNGGWAYVIPDQAVLGAAGELFVTAENVLPGGAKSMAQYTEDEPAARAEHFRQDLSLVAGRITYLLAAAWGALSTESRPNGPPP